MRDADLRKIVERDYRELAQILLPGCAWKSAVVLAGSILEAVLYDRLTAVPALTRATPEEQWRLADLIRVAAERGLLPASRAEAIDPALREYRDFLHPRTAIRAAHPATEAEATLAKGTLDAVCNHLDEDRAGLDLRRTTA